MLLQPSFIVYLRVVAGLGGQDRGIRLLLKMLFGSGARVTSDPTVCSIGRLPFFLPGSSSSSNHANGLHVPGPLPHRACRQTGPSVTGPAAPPPLVSPSRMSAWLVGNCFGCIAVQQFRQRVGTFFCLYLLFYGMTSMYQKSLFLPPCGTYADIPGQALFFFYRNFPQNMGFKSPHFFYTSEGIKIEALHISQLFQFLKKPRTLH